MKLQHLQLIALLSLALGIFLRFSGLGNMLYSHDEAYTSLRAAGYTESEMIETVWNGDVIAGDDIRYFLKPSESKNINDTISSTSKSEPMAGVLYYIFSHYWMRIIGSSPAAMRGLSAVFSILTIPAMYWFCQELFRSKRIALASSIIISLSPFSLLYAQDARSYSLWALLTLLSSAAFLAALRKNQIVHWSVYLVFNVIGLHSQLFFALVIIAHGLYLVVAQPYRHRSRFSRYLLVLILTLLMSAPWLYQLVAQWSKVQLITSWTRMEAPWYRYIHTWLRTFSSPVFDLYLGPGNLISYIMRVPVLLLIGYALFHLVVSTPRHIWAFLVLLISATALPFLLSDLLRGGILSTQGRYFAAANTAIIPVIANLLVGKISEPVAKSHYKWYLMAGLVLIAQLGSAINIMLADTWWTKRLSWIEPDVINVLNQEDHPLLVVYGVYSAAPTDFGDVLALSTMVDDKVMFSLLQEDDPLKVPSGSSNIYWFGPTFGGSLNTETGMRYEASEVIPDKLWRIDER